MTEGRHTWVFVVLASCASQPAPPPAAPPCIPTPVPPPAPGSAADAPAEELSAAPGMMVPPSLLEGRRIKGSISIAPDDSDKVAMIEHRVSRVIHSSKLCIDLDGNIVSVTMLRSSGLPGYDEKIQKHIKGTWRYSPYMVNCRPVPVCTGVTIIYTQHSPPPRRYRIR